MSTRFLSLSLLLLALVMSACVRDAELRIRNRSTTDITVTLDYSDSRVVRPSEDYTRFYNTDKDVTVQYNGLYVFSRTISRWVERGRESIVTINSDGGAIRVINSSNRTISAVYLSGSNDVTWGPNDLNGTIAPGESVSWTVSSGFWDIKIRNNLGEEFSYYSKQVLLDSTYTQNFQGRGESGSKGDRIQPQSAPMYSEQFGQ